VITPAVERGAQEPGNFKRPLITAWRVNLVLTAALLLVPMCGCSTFNRDWKKAAHQPIPPDSMEGRWEGKWLSDVNGHTGKLRGLLSRESDEHYAARYRATYGKISHFSYTVRLAVQPHNDGWEFNGEENLGKMAGGVYYYEGRASPTNFVSTYRSKYDHGIFEMHRPE
jgi:hypothetical protein